MALSDDFERCIAAGGVAVFPADTVYGLACDPRDAAAVGRLYALKGRPPDRPAAVMFFAPEPALELLGPRTRAAAARLFPGPLTLLVCDPARRFPLAGGGDVLGLRVPDLPLLAGVGVAVLQSSANRSGGPDARRLQDVPAELRAGADMVIDGGELPGTPSTVVDLSDYESSGKWTVVRVGAVAERDLASALD